MAIYKLATAIQMGSQLPRDAMMINPVINNVSGLGGAQQLVDDWATVIKTFSGITTAGQITVKAYDCEGTKPVYPAATKILNPGTTMATSTYPREIALCLSFYNVHNAPRMRGRLYIPLAWMNSVTGPPGERPSAAYIAKVAGLATSLQSLGGIDDDWSVWSGIDKVARKVTNWFVDDEWDTQRRRGLRSTSRTVGTTSE